MSDSDEIVVNKRRTNRLNLDSEEEARIQAEQQRRQEEIRLRKEEKRRRRQEQARLAQEEEQRKKELQRKFMDPRTMIQPDSDSNDLFERAQQKIKKAYPDARMPKQMQRKKRRAMSESELSDSDQDDSDSQDSQSDSESELISQTPKKKKIKKEVRREKKERKRQERAEQIRASKHKQKVVKIEEQDPKESLVNQVAVRWWYCLPEWPPADFDYSQALRKQGYRLVTQDQFRIEQNLMNGLLKATPIDGFLGIYKTKQKIIDVRPKENCPSLNFLRNKTIEELTSLLKEALSEQIKSINSQSFKTEQDEKVEIKLTKRLNQIS